jgi:Flp pilus assembly protein TadG
MRWGRESGRGFVRAGAFARGERGSQLVELAIVLPILLVLFATIGEFGNFFYTYTTLNKATRVGARYLVSRTFSQAEQDKAKSLVIYGDANAGCAGTPVLPGLSCANVSVAGEGGAAGYPDRVTVQITGYTYQPLFDLGRLTNRAFTLAVPISPATTMKYLLF